MTKQDAEALLKRHGTQRKAAAAAGVSRRTFQRVIAGHIRAARMVNVDLDKPEAETLRGFAVGTETRMLEKKPATTLRARFYQLKRGMAFRVDDVARDWVVSVETVRRHAQDADCFRYIETGKEQWEPCVMHPDTAKLYPVK